MLELLTLKRLEDLNREIQRLEESDYWGPMDEEGIVEIQTTRQPEYSFELRDLIRRCLRTSPKRRPTHEELYNDTLQALESKVQATNDPITGLKTGPRVFYMGHEINDMPVGQRDLGEDQAIPYHEREFKVFNRTRYMDPDLETLRNGRWDPVVQLNGNDIASPVPGGRKRRQSGVGYLFMPDPKYPQAVMKKIHMASDEDDESSRFTNDSGGDGDSPDGDDDGNRHEDHTDRGEKRGPPGGGGKTRGGKDGGRGGKGIGRGGMAVGGKAPGKGKGKGKGVGGKEVRRQDGEGGGASTDNPDGNDIDTDGINGASGPSSLKESLEIPRKRRELAKRK